MVQHRVTEAEVEALVGEGEVSASAAAVRTSTPNLSAFSSSAASIPGEISVAVARSIAPARSKLSEKYPVPADLQGVSVGPIGPSPERLPQLAADLLLTDGAEVDSPFGVV